MTANELHEAYSTNVSLRYGGEKTFWQLYRSGQFHFRTVWPAQEGEAVGYGDLCDFITDAMNGSASLYGALGFSDQNLHVDVFFHQAENRLLNFPGMNTAENVCRIPEIEVHLNCSAADLISGREVHAGSLIRGICERFNVSDGRHLDLKDRIRRRLRQSN